MQGFGAKVDARLKELEARCVFLTDRTEELFEMYCSLLERIEALEAKRGPGRPPKAPNGE